MKKKELVEHIANSAELTKSQAEAALKSTLEGITIALKKKESVTMVGFGTFSTSERKARIGRNPQNGEPLNIAAKTIVKFKTGKALGDEVNNG